MRCSELEPFCGVWCQAHIASNTDTEKVSKCGRNGVSTSESVQCQLEGGWLVGCKRSGTFVARMVINIREVVVTDASPWSSEITSATPPPLRSGPQRMNGIGVPLMSWLHFAHVTRPSIVWFSVWSLSATQRSVSVDQLLLELHALPTTHRH